MLSPLPLPLPLRRRANSYRPHMQVLELHPPKLEKGDDFANVLRSKVVDIFGRLAVRRLAACPAITLFADITFLACRSRSCPEMLFQC